MRKKSAGKKSVRPTRRGQRPPNDSTSVADSTGNAESSAPADRWGSFRSTYSGHPALASDTIYAIPEGLIDAICAEAPNLLSAEDQTFERTLSSLFGVGMFLGRPISFPPLAAHVAKPVLTERGAELARRQRESSNELHEMLVDDLRHSGRTDEEVQAFFDIGEALQQKIAIRQASYIGWLITNSHFHRDVDGFRQKWETKVKRSGGFPEFPRSLFGEAPAAIPTADRDFYGDYIQFYRRWALDTLASCELPLPMRGELTGFSLYQLSSANEAGLVAFVPWYLLRDKDITLHELAAYKQIGSLPEHLRPWIDRTPKNWGHDRYKLMLELYVYLELCLGRRYRERLRGNGERLDLAFSRFYSKQSSPNAPESKVETIRKVRQEMNRRLKS